KDAPWLITSWRRTASPAVVMSRPPASRAAAHALVEASAASAAAAMAAHQRMLLADCGYFARHPDRIVSALPATHSLCPMSRPGLSRAGFGPVINGRTKSVVS